MIKELIKHDYKVITIAPVDHYTSKLTSEGIIHYNVPIDRRGLTLISNLKTLVSVYRLYRCINPDIVIHFTIKPVLFGTLIARISCQAKVINNVTGLGYIFIGTTLFHIFLRPPVKWMYRGVLKLSSLLIFQNEDDRTLFIKSKIISEEIPRSVIISGSGVDLNKFKKEKKYSSESEINFILVARMLYDKGIQEYIEAAKIIKQRNNNVIFHLLGDIDEGNPTSIPLKTINEWVSQGIVSYHGMVDDVRPFLDLSDVFVLPSYREGLSKSIVEAMAMELPIITTNVPGCRETVVANRNGILVTPSKVNELIDAMQFLIINPTKRKIMGKTSREIAQNKYNVDIVNRSYLEYITILSKKRLYRSNK